MDVTSGSRQRGQEVANPAKHSQRAFIRAASGWTVGLALTLLMMFPLEAVAHHDELVDKIERGRTELVSVASSGEQGDAHSGWQRHPDDCFHHGSLRQYAASDNGRYTAFSSRAGNLHPADVNGQAIVDIFVYDRKKRELQLVSAMPSGLAFELPPGMPDDPCKRPLHPFRSFEPVISGNGRYVAFASDLPLTGIKNGPLGGVEVGLLPDQIFVRDLKKGVTELVSPTWDGMPPGGSHASGRDGISISDDGRFVAFTSGVTNLVEGVCDDLVSELPVLPAVTECKHIYVRDRTKDETLLVTKSSSDEPANYEATYPSISGNGRYVAFESEADNLVAGDDNTCLLQGGPSCMDVFAHNLRTGETDLISTTLEGEPGNGRSRTYNWSSGHQAISNDGRIVAFASEATDLVPAGGAGGFIRDRKTGRTERVSVSSTGTALPGSYGPSISDDGVFVGMGLSASTTTSSFFPPSGSSNEHSRFGGHFVHDRGTGQADRWAEGPHGGGSERDHPNAVLETPVIGGNARFLLGFRHLDEIGADGDSNGFPDVFVRDIGHYGRGIGPLNPMHNSVRSAPDPAGDALVSGLGADIVGVKVIERPELDDLYAAIELEHMGPGLTVGPARLFVGNPSLLYGLRFKVDGKSYEVRATSLSGGTFGLFDCTDTAPLCTRVATLKGGYGTTGERVVFSLPLAEIGIQADGELSNVQAFSGLGSYLAGATNVLDQVRLK